MGSVLTGIVALLVVLWFMHKYVRANPTGTAWLAQRAGGLLALVAGVLLTLRGLIGLGVPLGLLGLSLLGWMRGVSFLPSWMGGASQVSRQRTAFIEVAIDHVTGAMRGRVIAGRRAGADLDALDDATLDALMAEMDPASRQLLMAYRDRRQAGWREHAQGSADARQRGAASSGKMTEEEAYKFLGLEPGAGAEEIGQAYRALMKKLHPDQGGPTYLAARINEAKDVLLRRHR
ncbi:MAG TPA: DnaJ domain-containing protein [Xanthobacteraceae bacterium]|nr:DnaJ domain-containing protein [Xanthobacteraceae bacterium]